MRIDVISPREIDAGLAARWRAHQAADPEIASPFLGPDWARAVEAARPRARVRIAVQDDGAAVFAVRRRAFTAEAVGAPMSDYQGVVAGPGVVVELPTLLRALGVHRYDFTHVPASQTALSSGFRGGAPSRIVAVGAGLAAYQAELKARGSDLVKDVGKRRRRMEREAGEVLFTLDDPDPAALDQLVAWKRGQYRETRQTDVLGHGWTRRLLDGLLARRGEDFGATLSTLRVGGRLAAAHLGLRGGDVMHAWFVAHDCELARYSPGMVLMGELTQALAEAAPRWREFDLGPGDYPFKLRLCNAARPLGYGFVGRPSPAAAMRSAAYTLRAWAEAAPLGRASALPGKAMRRWDIVRALAT